MFGMVRCATMHSVSQPSRFQWPFSGRARRVQQIRSSWAQQRTADRNLATIAAFSNARVMPNTHVIDERTWVDLTMDDVFAELDRTTSPVGQQALYHRLRQGQRTLEELDQFEALVEAMRDDASTREEAQLALCRISHPSSADIWSLTEPNVLPSTPWYWAFPVLAAFTFIAIAAVPFWKPALLLVLASTIVSMTMRASIASWMLVVSGPFRQIGPLLECAERLAAVLPEKARPRIEGLRASTARLAALGRIASIAKRDSGAPGDIAGIIVEYFNLVFYLDGIALLLGRHQLERHRDALLHVLDVVGTVDAAVAVASWRTEHANWCRPSFSEAADLTIESVWHPLIARPVTNPVHIAPRSGLLITGSNMSGKTTYLRTIGVATLLAQTIHTVPASNYAGPTLSIRSSIGRSDSIAEGKSYYLAEAEAVLACLADASAGHRSLFLFDELFRGTNVVERLAAGEAVLRAILDATAASFVVVATHDAELVGQLADRYTPLHFDGALTDGELRFDYTVKPGRATSRNAIALLSQLGAPPALVAMATARASALDAARPS